MPHRSARILLSASFAFCCAAAAWRSGQLAWAHHLASAPGVDPRSNLRRASRIIPEDADLLLRLNQPGRSLEKNPRLTAARIELGLAAEASGDFPRAEAALLQAAELDHTCLPRWTLANYYLRRDDWRAFWLWARRTAEIPYSDPVPIFQLCWRVSRDATEILNRAVPLSPDIRRSYLAFLLERKKLDAALPLARELSRSPVPSDRDLMLGYCDLALGARRGSEALEAWNALARWGLIPYSTLDPANGVSLTNADFAVAPATRGFDWRFDETAGVSTSYSASDRELRVSLSGKQPESCDILEQYAPVVAGTDYVFEAKSTRATLEPGSGLEWSVSEGRDGPELASAAGPRLAFTTAPGCTLVRLVLRYRRPKGSVRVEGYVVLHAARLARRLA